MLKALFKLVWNAQRTTWKIFVSTKGKIFLNIEKVLVEISEEQLMYYIYLIVFLHIFDILKLSNFYRPKTLEM